jgi:methyl-accepting chemotaxis protein
MKSATPIGSAEINQSSEMDVGENMHELTCASDTFRQVENRNAEMSASALGTLLRRVHEASTHEIENLIDDLQQLHKKLQNDGSRIQHDIEEYTELSQHVMQLTTIIADSVKKLPAAPPITPQVD